MNTQSVPIIKLETMSIAQLQALANSVIKLMPRMQGLGAITELQELFRQSLNDSHVEVLIDFLRKNGVN